MTVAQDLAVLVERVNVAEERIAEMQLALAALRSELGPHHARVDKRLKRLEEPPNPPPAAPRHPEAG